MKMTSLRTRLQVTCRYHNSTMSPGSGRYPPGKKYNFAPADREAWVQVRPSGAIPQRRGDSACRRRPFLGRAGGPPRRPQGGIRQFPALCSGLPTQANVHELAQQGRGRMRAGSTSTTIPWPPRTGRAAAWACRQQVGMVFGDLRDPASASCGTRTSSPRSTWPSPSPRPARAPCTSIAAYEDQPHRRSPHCSTGIT